MTLYDFSDSIGRDCDREFLTLLTREAHCSSADNGQESHSQGGVVLPPNPMVRAYTLYASYREDDSDDNNDGFAESLYDWRLVLRASDHQVPVTILVPVLVKFLHLAAP